MDKREEQPKDFVPQTFEEFCQDEFDKLGIWHKIYYHWQDYTIEIAVAIGIGSYFAGMTFGKFW